MRPVINRAVIALALCTVSIIIYGLWYMVVETKSARVAELQSQIDIKKETAGRIALARNALVDIASDEDTVQGYFVQETGIVSFIDDLESRGRIQKVAVTVLSVSKETVNGRPTLSFSVSIKGTFDSVMRTVGTIEYAPYNISIATLSLGKNDKDEWHADMKLLVGSIIQTSMP